MPKAATQPKKKSMYGVHPGVAMTQKWVTELKQKTGRSLEEWLRLIKKSGPKDEKARREWLKTEHGLGTNSAWWLAERAEGKGSEVGDPDAYLEAAEAYGKVDRHRRLRKKGSHHTSHSHHLCRGH